MPQTRATSGPHLAIILEQPLNKQPHSPGDIIRGRVHRRVPGVAPEVRVTVTIHGRTKSKVAVRRGQHTHWYRTSINTLSAPVETQVLAAGAPLHIPAGSAGESWPFAIQIPPFVNDIRSEWQRKYFRSPGGSPETPFPPPGTFSFDKESFLAGKVCSAFTEYYVQARLELRHAHKGRMTRDSHTAIAPFPLRNVQPGPPIADFDMRLCRRQETISAYNLVPGTGELSFGQKTRQIFASSKVPRLTFSVTLSLPETLQVGNKGIIPVTLGVIPVNRLTSDIIHDVPQTIRIKSFNLRVKAYTDVQAEKHSFSDSGNEIRLIPVTNSLSLLNGSQGITIPVTPGQGIEAQSAPIELGQLLGIRVPTSNLEPDLITYNISHTHQLKWELGGLVADEHFKMNGSQAVRVLPNAGRDGELPEYSKGKEALPSYGEAVNA
ncbi:hypothetical protein BDV18DRAFT_158486 [Aspergillus unguis]